MVVLSEVLKLLRRHWLVVAGVLVLGGGWWLAQGTILKQVPTEKSARQGRSPVRPTKVEVELTENQAKAIQIVPVERSTFQIDRTAVGSIDFNQNMVVQVFTPYQGRILTTRASVGDHVLRGQVLFTVDSPDLLQAESALIAASGVATLQARNLKRVVENLRSGGGAQKDVDQTTSDQQAAEGALRSARDAVRIFGKTDEEMDRMIVDRRVDPVLVVRSPIAGLVTQRSAAPGLFVQPGNAPAPFTVADTSTMWMVANVAENDSAMLSVGQPVKVRVTALVDREFDGTISVVGASVDANTRRVMVRSEVEDPRGLLRAGMFANFTIQIGNPIEALSVPSAAVVREGDGTMTVWSTADRRHFEKHTVKIGLQRRGRVEIEEGVRVGELVAADGAVFLSNKLLAGATD
ncbi:MAG TPA: efflux RND transporter periplasmic adaptor subunit [Reyranella sp.]|nr:efflux RND transporter periplasmic adaptor subunit [Reyranella sp.]